MDCYWPIDVLDRTNRIWIHRKFNNDGFFRFLSGLGVVSAITVYTAIIVEQTPLKERAKLLAYVAAATTLGASLGYYLGGFLATNPIDD